jgi:uncharacterized membrane protein
MMELIQKIIHALTQVHPPHLLLVHFPIALTTTSFFFILLAWIKKSEVLEKVAFANISLAAVSTIVTAVVGISDNLKRYNGMAPNHTAKIILASILFVITSAIAIIRWRNPRLFDQKVSKLLLIFGYFISFAIASVLGFLGGVIIYGM